ncbi:MAG TPA: hypothetical protein VFL13_06970, partial [Candidatus Baltobacteraceae bacterium]|nr:hypothetical protein [Candidatus Baltobacteraceae bacterium]
MARRLFAILLASAIAGCSGGGGGLLPGSRSSVQSTGSIHISLTLGAPSTAKAIARGRNYISYSTRGLSMQIATHGQTISSGTIKTLDVSPGNANCVTSGNQRQCGWTIANLAPGWIDMQLSLWDTAPANGTTPAGTLLSQSTVVTEKIDSGASVYPSFTTIAPIVSGAQLSLQPATMAYGSSNSTTLYIALLDPQRNIIIDDGTGSTLDKTLTVSST